MAASLCEIISATSQRLVDVGATNCAGKNWRINQTMTFYSFSYFKKGDGAFNLDNIDPHLYTHLIYAFASDLSVNGSGFGRELDAITPSH